MTAVQVRSLENMPRGDTEQIWFALGQVTEGNFKILEK